MLQNICSYTLHHGFQVTEERQTMAKSSTPLRLESTLVEAAEQARKLAHRSVAGQIEYWASLGRVLARIATPEQITSLQAGIARLQIENLEAEPVDPDAVFSDIERARVSGELAERVTTSAVRYQASRANPGLLERLAPDGAITVGTFHKGQFQPVKPAAAARR
jgi:ParD-like antitoxin of type II bacterial toxin-antitoxin system